MTRCGWFLTASLLLAPATTLAQDKTPAAAPATASADEQQIRGNAAKYVEAYNRHDAKAVAALWSPDAVYANRTTGEQVTGRAAIEKQMAAIFERDKKSRLEVTVDTIQFVSPSVAVERGSVRVVRPEKSPEQSNYTAVDVKRDGEWILDRVTEDDVPETPAAHEQLKQLEFLIGSWGDEDARADVVNECKWARNENFLTWTFSVSMGGQVRMAGMQVVGYDAANKRFRSWVFDSDGGFAEGTWEHKGKRWYIRQVGTLPDGRRSTALNIITQLDANSFTWQSIDREIGGRVEPNVDEIKMVRKSP